MDRKRHQSIRRHDGSVTLMINFLAWILKCPIGNSLNTNNNNNNNNKFLKNVFKGSQYLGVAAGGALQAEVTGSYEFFVRSAAHFRI